MRHQHGHVGPDGAPWTLPEAQAGRWDRVVLVTAPDDRGVRQRPEDVATMAPEDASLHVRIRAIEHLIVATMASDDGALMDLARMMAERLSPAADVARYSLTVRIGDQMTSLVRSAERLREATVA